MVHKFLMNVPEEKALLLRDGSRVLNIEELRNELKYMSEEVFKEYVNESKNKFYDWIKDCVGDEKLAEKIKDVKNKKRMLDIINSRIIYLRLKEEEEKKKSEEEIIKNEEERIRELEENLRKLEEELEAEKRELEKEEESISDWSSEREGENP